MKILEGLEGYFKISHSEFCWLKIKSLVLPPFNFIRYLPAGALHGVKEFIESILCR
jgi:hypothetical protein